MTFRLLDGTDRCDRCGARATIRLEFSGDRELMFCTHHAREYGFSDRLPQTEQAATSGHAG